MDIYQPILVIGGGGGGPFNAFGGQDGKVLQKIGVWVGGWQIKAIRVWLTDSDPTTFGEPSGPYKEFEFNPGERIIRLSLWGNGAGTRTGWIHFETSQGRTFDHGMTDWGRRQEYPIDVGSGICMGVLGRAGADIDNLGFVFLKPIKSAVLRDVRYPTLAFDTQGIAPETIDVFSDQNNGKVPRTWTFAGARKVSTTTAWSTTVGLELYSEATVSAGVPEVAKVEAKFGWKVSTSTTHSKSETVDRDLSWSEQGTLNPGDSIHLQALTRRGKITLSYEGIFEITLRNGVTFSYPVKGVYDGLTYTGVEISETTLAEIESFQQSAEPAPLATTVAMALANTQVIPEEPALVMAGSKK